MMYFLGVSITLVIWYFIVINNCCGIMDNINNNADTLALSIVILVCAGAWFVFLPVMVIFILVEKAKR